MEADRWRRISEMIDRVFDLSPEDRPALLDDLRRSNPGLARDVDSFLRQGDPPPDLEAPPPGLIAQLGELPDRTGGNSDDAFELIDDGGTARDGIETLTRSDSKNRSPHAAEDEPAGQPPSSAGEYTICDEIARGGMGAVYTAIDPDFNRRLAIKILLPKALAWPDAESRFFREARITGQLQHPGIPPVHRVGRLDDGRPFLAMKLIEGETLARVLEGPADEGDRLHRLLDIFEQMCQTLAYAHSVGVIHRDLKPQNVMVGRFGQVQVMDWGLARRLTRTGKAIDSDSPVDPATAVPSSGLRSDDSPSTEIPSEETPSEETPSEETPSEETPSTETPSTADGLPAELMAEGSTAGQAVLTEDGLALGTPAYMAPEQQSGGTFVDERSDVFGLGGILCVILTGLPPRVATSYHRLKELGASDLDEAFERLDRCAADSELIEIARKCLAPDPRDRYAHAGKVADAIDAYRRSLQRKRREAELSRERMAVQAAEERKRRRITVALAIALLGVVTSASVLTVLIVQSRQSRRQRQVSVNDRIGSALYEAEQQHNQIVGRLESPEETWSLLSDLSEWEQSLSAAEASLHRARQLEAGESSLVTADATQHLRRIEEWLTQQRHYLETVSALQEIRLRASDAHHGLFNLDQVDPLYREQLLRLGLDIATTEAPVLADQIRASPLRYAIVATLDHWAGAIMQSQHAKKLLELSRTTDTDPWRDQLRQVESWNDLSRLERLAQDVEPKHQSPHILATLASRIRQLGGRPDEVLRRALLEYPGDFWLLFALGNSHPDPSRREACFRAALALRPDSSVVHNNLGNVLHMQGEDQAAEEHFLRALEIDPSFAPSHHNLGVFYEARGDYEAAIWRFLAVLEVVPENVSSHFHLGVNYSMIGRSGEAIEHYQLAIKHRPRHDQALCNLALIYFDLGQWDRSESHFLSAIEVNPHRYESRLGLGNLRYQQRDFVDAVDQYRQATKCNPAAETAWNNLGMALVATGENEEARESYRRAISVHPGYASPHFNLGNLLWDLGELAEAEAHYRQSAALAPRHAESWCNLGHVLRFQGELEEAVEAMRRGHQLGSARPDWGYESDQWLREYEALLASQSIDD